jgi:hypothetical protein
MKSHSSHPFTIIIAAAFLAAGTLQKAAAVEEGDFAFDTTKDLYDVCSAETADPNHIAAQTACTAFIEATVQYHDEVSDRKRLKRLVCYPQGTTIADGRTAFLAWAQQNSGNAERMEERPVVGLVRALATAFPCR